jgi:ribosomal protein S12 methylthiotransferase accessory factor
VAGAGATEEDALIRTVAEAAERCWAAYHGNEDVVRATHRELGRAALPIDEMLQISKLQYAERAYWNAAYPGRHAIPPPADPDLPVDWMKAANANRWAPAGLILLGHPDRSRAPWAHSRSSGLAFGSSMEEARTRALLEVVERDAVAIWWYNRLSYPDAISSASTWVREIESWLREQGRHLSFLDLSHDVAVPVVAAVSWNNVGREPVVGTGAGTTRAEAMESALREHLLCMVNMSMLAHTATTLGPSQLDHDALHMLMWNRTATVQSATWLLPTRAGTHVTRSRELRDSGGILQELIVRLERRHLMPLFFEPPRERSIGFVSRALVPAFRTTCARFAPGRLYDVPVKLRWIGEAREEHSLNPAPYPF